jgi:hypothetical protein
MTSEKILKSRDIKENERKGKGEKKMERKNL